MRLKNNPATETNLPVPVRAATPTQLLLLGLAIAVMVAGLIKDSDNWRVWALVVVGSWVYMLGMWWSRLPV